MSSEESYKLDFLIDGLKSFGGFASTHLVGSPSRWLVRENSGGFTGRLFPDVVSESCRWGILGGEDHTMWWV
jgi:hypothetical protein